MSFENISAGLVESFYDLVKTYSQSPAALSDDQSVKYFEVLFSIADALHSIDPLDGIAKDNYEVDANELVISALIDSVREISDPLKRGYRDSFMLTIANASRKSNRLHDGLVAFYAQYDTEDGLMEALKQEEDFVVMQKIMTLINSKV